MCTVQSFSFTVHWLTFYSIWTLWICHFQLSTFFGPYITFLTGTLTKLACSSTGFELIPLRWAVLEQRYSLGEHLSRERIKLINVSLKSGCVVTKFFWIFKLKKLVLISISNYPVFYNVAVQKSRAKLSSVFITFLSESKIERADKYWCKCCF